MENITETKYSEGYCKQVGTTRQILPCVHEESFYCFKEMLGSWSVLGVAEQVWVMMLRDR